MECNDCIKSAIYRLFVDRYGEVLIYEMCEKHAKEYASYFRYTMNDIVYVYRIKDEVTL